MSTTGTDQQADDLGAPPAVGIAAHQGEDQHEQRAEKVTKPIQSILLECWDPATPAIRARVMKWPPRRSGR